MPNRKQRRAQQARERTGQSRFVAVPLDDAARERFKPENLPEGYTQLIGLMAEKLIEWRNMFPTVRLEWHDGGDVLVTGGLDSEAAKFLAKNEAAQNLLRWLDEQTGGEGTVFQARVALRCIGAFRQPEVVRDSGGERIVQAFANKAPNGLGHRLEQFACPHCDRPLDTHSGEGDEAPRPGHAISICCYCAELMHYTEERRWEALPEPVFESLPADQRRAIADAQAIIRQTNAQMAFGTRPKRIDA